MTARSRFAAYAIDVLVVLVAAVGGAARELSDANLEYKHVLAPVWAYALAQVAAAALLFWRRRHPEAVAVGIGAISVFAPATAFVFAPYAVTAYGRDRRRGWVAIGALLVLWGFGAHVWAIADPFTGPIVLFGSALLGMYVRARRNLLDELAEQARTDERVRLAGEMHDVVTHRINLMVLQAGALRVSTDDPAVRAAADELRAAGCQALAELRDVVGVLRSGAPLPRPAAAGQPGDDPRGEVPALVAQSRSVGLPVRLDETGDASAVAPAVRRTVVRVVQESLTNVHKHAPGAEAAVTVRYGADGVCVSVSNTVSHHPVDPALAATGGGSGLLGLRHRVEVVGGTLAAGSTPDGGFAVTAELPARVSSGAIR